MPLFDYVCKDCQSHFVGLTTVNNEGPKCPTCGVHGERQFTPTTRIVTQGFMSESEHQAVLAERARLEARADDFRTGKLIIKEGGKYEPRLGKSVY